MSLITFKIFAAVSIFFIGLISGLLPISVMKNHQKALTLGDAFASGIFLGAAFFHMLPNAQASFAQTYPTTDYPLASVACMAGFLLLLGIERIIIEMTQSDQSDQSKVTGFLLLIILSIHSLIEGAAVGINLAFAAAFVIYLAIIAHKGSASFALAVNLARTQLSNRTIFLMIFLFSLMTPVGIGIASLVTEILQQRAAQITEAIFNAVAAGTFIYIGTRHLMEKQFAEFKHSEKIIDFSAVLIGILLMAIVAIWV